MVEHQHTDRIWICTNYKAKTWCHGAELSNGSASALHYVQSRDIAAAADKQFQISSNSSMKEFGSILT